MKFILGSTSKSRAELIKIINIVPDMIIGADIDETPKKKEKPEVYVKRVAFEKMQRLLLDNKDDIILTADSIMTRNRRIMQKAKTDQEVIEMLNFMSGKSIKALTSVCVARQGLIMGQKLVSTKLKIKRLSNLDIQEYVESKQGLNKAGGVFYEGLFNSFVKEIIGSSTNIMGLPLYEVRNMLITAGLK